MYEDLVISLRCCAEYPCYDCKYRGVYMDSCDGALKNEAADAIEELSCLIDRYGGETGIKNLQEYASKYWDLLAKTPSWIPVTETLPETSGT